jgi:hypothetical protein
MKYVVKTASRDMIYILIFTKISIGIQKFKGNLYKRRQTHTQTARRFRKTEFIF